MAIQTKYQKDLEDGKIKPKPVVAPPKKVVVPARTVLKNSTPKAAPPKAAPIPSYCRPMPVPKTLVRPPVAPPRTMKDPQQDFVRRGGKTGGTRVDVPPGVTVDPMDLMIMNPLGMVGTAPIAAAKAAPMAAGLMDDVIRSFGLEPFKGTLQEQAVKQGLLSADEIQYLINKAGQSVEAPVISAGNSLGSRVMAGGKYTAQTIAEAMKKFGGAGGNILQYLGGVAGRNPKLTGTAALGAAGLGYYGLNGGFDGGGGGGAVGANGSSGSSSPMYNQPYGGGVSNGPAWTPNQGVYGAQIMGPQVPGLNLGGGSFYNPTEEQILNSPYNQPYGGGLGGGSGGNTTLPPFVPGVTDTPAPVVPDGNGGGGGATNTGPGTNTGGGFFGPQSMAEMMAMFTQMKDLFGDDGGQLDQIMAMYTELQKSMMDLQNKYIQSLIDAQKPVAPPVAPAPNLGPEAFVPPYISPSAQNGAYLEMSDPGMGALYNMNPMYLQSVQQMLNTLGYTGAGVAGRYGERSYSRPGGPGSLAIGDAAYENAANYVGLPATERENAEAAMRYFFGEMGNSPRYQFPGRPQYPTRA